MMAKPIKSLLGAALVLALLTATALAVNEPQIPDPITISIDPPSTEVEVGETFTVDIKVDAGAQPVSSIQAFVDFDPIYLKVIDAAGNPTDEIEPVTDPFNSVMLNRADNAAGEIDYAAGTFGTAPTGSFVLATIRFEALNGTAETRLEFSTTPPRGTKAKHGTDDLPVELSDGTAIISGPTPTATSTSTPTPTPSPTATPTSTPKPSTPGPPPTPTLTPTHGRSPTPTSTPPPGAPTATPSLCPACAGIPTATHTLTPGLPTSTPTETPPTPISPTPTSATTPPTPAPTSILPVTEARGNPPLFIVIGLAGIVAVALAVLWGKRLWGRAE